MQATLADYQNAQNLFEWARRDADRSAETADEAERALDKVRMQTFPDGSHWHDLTMDGHPINEQMHGQVSYWDTDQGKKELLDATV